MNLLNELKRRNVLRVGAAYVVTAWLVVQVVETLFPIYGLPESALRLIINVLATGLIPVLVLSWVFEWTPEGLKREQEIVKRGAASLKAARRLDRIILVVLALALGYFAFDEFVLEPRHDAREAELQRAEINQAKAQGRAEARAVSYGDMSIAVLPFRDMSPESDQEYFAEGIAEELLNILARESRVRVISRTSSFSFKDRALEIPEIANRLKVGHILEGSVRKDGDMLRITAQFIEARSDTQLWSQTWDRKLENVFAVQDEIAQSVVASLETEWFGTTRGGSPEAAARANPRAYELVLRGRYLLNQQDTEALDRAQRFYEQAIEVAPDYAAAWGGLARTLKVQLDWKRLDVADMTPRIEAALERALSLDPRDADALATRGRMLMNSDLEAARTHYRTAITVNPSDADAYRWLGLTYLSSDPLAYRDNIRQSYLVDPTNRFTNSHMVLALNRFGRFDEALTVAHDYYQLEPGDWLPLQWAGEIRGYQQRFGEALKYFYFVHREQPQVLGPYSNLIWLMVQTGFEQDLTEAWIREFRTRAGEHYLRSPPDVFPEVGFHVLSGRGERGIQLLEEVQEHGRLADEAIVNFAIRADRTFARARALIERNLGGEQVDSLSPEKLMSPMFADYVLVLERAGEHEKAVRLADAIRRVIEVQLEEGVLYDGFMWPLRVRLAELHASASNTQEALKSLRNAVDSGDRICLPCLRVFPHFDGLRGDPGFESILQELDRQLAMTLARLSEQGMLMTPDAVRSLDEFDFIPLSDIAVR